MISAIEPRLGDNTHAHLETQSVAGKSSQGNVDGESFQAVPIAESFEIEVEEAEEFAKGTFQPPAYRDTFFAILFMVQVIIMFVMAALYSSYAFLDSIEVRTEQGDDTEMEIDRLVDAPSLFIFLVLTFISAICATVFFLRLMAKYSRSFVKTAFLAPLVPVVMFLVMALFMLPSGDKSAFVIFLAAAIALSAFQLFIYCWYRKFADFVSANVHIALSAIQANRGLYFMSAAFLLADLCWGLVWTVTVIGINTNAMIESEWYPCNEPDESTEEMCSDDTINWFLLTFLVLCYYWTNQVLRNVLQCTTVGAVGSWWFNPPTPMDSSHYISPQIKDSFDRSTTFSFGSICLGSLLVSVAEVLKHMISSARRSRRHPCGALLLCVLECMNRYMIKFLDYFNSWAFVYVGLYGYDYITAGKNVLAMFMHRGYTAIISNHLVSYALFFSKIGIATVTGLCALIVHAVFGVPNFADDLYPEFVFMLVFTFGFLLGFVMGDTALTVVHSAVQTTIVCFAESPGDFQESHRELYTLVSGSWAEAYPVVDSAIDQDQNPPPLAEAAVLT